ncbi:MAG: hypothetical protein ICV64_10095 [Thermoleophilia bacterium]|nr:hypothetical protein [Thermoleophilia bacterium]
MVVADAIRPRGPYSLALTAEWAGDATRRVRDGVLTCALPGGACAAAWQRPDGRVVVRATGEEALARMRFVLALEDDHSEFLRRFRADELLGPSTSRLRGLRPLRVATVVQALLRAFCGQLIDSKTARDLERRIVRAATPAATAPGLHEPPDARQLAAFAPARLRALGLHARRAAALVRLCGGPDPERLHGAPTAAVAALLERERGLGPWSAGVVCLEGLGRYEHGLVGDLGLVKLVAALRGRRVEAWETGELLARYGEWAGLASVYLLKGWARGLMPVPRA